MKKIQNLFLIKTAKILNMLLIGIMTIMMIKGVSGALTTLISSILVFISPFVTQLMLLEILVFILSVISIIKLRKYERIVLFKK